MQKFITLREITDWILPRICIGCGFHSENISLELCRFCAVNLPWLSGRCYQCGAKLLQATEAIICDKCQNSPPPFNRLCGLFEYKPPLNKLINRLKFGHKLYPAALFGKLLIDKIEHEWYRSKQLPQVIIPVPLHAQRHRKRGYNQAAEICIPIAKDLEVPLGLDICCRVRNTPAQARLNRIQRTANLCEAFTVKIPSHYKYVALVDDVVTTGSTIRAVSAALISSGVECIDIWCVCRG